MTKEDAIKYAEERFSNNSYHLEMGYLNRGLYQIKARENDFLRVAIPALKEQKTPCAACGYGGIHLDAPPCTTCPAHPKLESNLKVVESNQQVTEALRPNGSSDSGPSLATKNQVTSDWISVEDRLPEQTDPATFVLFVTTQGMQHVGTYFKGGATSQFDGFYSHAVRYEVTHWMPLPEPPKKEATDHAGAGEA